MRLIRSQPSISPGATETFAGADRAELGIILNIGHRVGFALVVWTAAKIIATLLSALQLAISDRTHMRGWRKSDA